jgi:CheY-like chemotaxis protein
MARQSANSLLRLLNDILDFSKIEAGKLELEAISFDLRDEMERPVQSLAVRAAQKGLELACRIDPQLPSDVIGDPGRLAQVLVNLVGNAIKFTEQGEVVVNVQQAERTETSVQVRVSVRDTGIGISEEKQQSVFEAFSQGDTSTTRNFGGTGLGLAICAHLAELMGGSTFMESREGRGSLFGFTATFAIPSQSKEEQPESQDDSPALKNAQHLKVLLAEDGLVNQKVAVDLLRLYGHEVVVANDGQEAVAAVEKDTFDVVLMDVRMPVMDGLEATAAIREREQTGRKRTPIIAMTAAAMKGDREKCLAAGMDSYIAKPIDAAELLQALAELDDGGNAP